jgi:hypothetical protein
LLGRLILLIAFILAVLTIIQLFKNTPKSQTKSLYWKVGLSASAIILILLAASGRIHWIGAAIGAMIPIVRRSIPLLLRYFPMVQQYLRTRPQQSPSANNTSEVKTAILSMTLDHDTDRLQGPVISGPFSGHYLDSLELEQLQSLMGYCHQQDKDSAKLLMSYLNHRFGNQWQTSPPPSGDGNLTEDSAYAVLGLHRGASRDEVIQAHRKMMQKVHPDRGGSDYLAAQINQAKDILISKLA